MSLDNVIGVAGAAHQPAGRLSLRYAWLSARWGSLPLEGGIEAAYRADIEAAADPVAKLKEIEERLNALRSPFRSAEKFWVEEIIDPRKTRSLLCEFARLAEPLRTPGGSRWSGSGSGRFNSSEALRTSRFQSSNFPPSMAFKASPSLSGIGPPFITIPVTV